jgi:hypothetical protein
MLIDLYKLKLGFMQTEGPSSETTYVQATSFKLSAGIETKNSGDSRRCAMNSNDEQNPQNANSFAESEKARRELTKWVDLAKKRYREIEKAKRIVQLEHKAA